VIVFTNTPNMTEISFKIKRIRCRIQVVVATVSYSEKRSYDLERGGDGVWWAGGRRLRTRARLEKKTGSFPGRGVTIQSG
jgi:hypothetical protein